MVKLIMMYIGRQHEQQIIHEKLKDTSKAQLVVLYGRRRVGKSTLIRRCVSGEKNVLFFEGIQGASTPEQIDYFLSCFSRQTGRVKLAARNWREVFQGMGELIQKDRWILVFDEFPWMAAGHTQLVSDLKLYWDQWCQNKNLVLFLCGSVASFMVKHIIHSKALHNRKTLEIKLTPLTPQESAGFMAKRGNLEKSKAYMVFGGVPKYLEQIDPKQSLEKNINRMCFCRDGFFVNEFETLFKEQFKAIRTYESIVKLLAEGPCHLSEIARKTRIERGGGLKSHLENLIQANFVKEYSPYKPDHRPKTRTKIYKLTDPFLLFYFHYMEPNRKLIEANKNENLFRAVSQNSIQQYYGYAFERFCEDSFDLILEKTGLRLSDLYNFGPYFQRPAHSGRGVQVDNLLMRRDNVWTLMEYKYSLKPVGTGIIREIMQKMARLPVPENVTVEKILISASGVTRDVSEASFFDHILSLSDLFLRRG